MIDFLYMMSQAKLAEYYETRTDLSIRKYVLIANMLRKTTLQEEDKAEEQWLDTCLDALDKHDDEIQDDANKKAITIQHFTFTTHQDKQQKLLLSSSHQQVYSQSQEHGQEHQHEDLLHTHKQQDVTVYRIVLS